MANKAATQLLRMHPLQRFPAPSRSWSLLLHATGLACFGYSFSYLMLNPNQANEAYGWHLQYLTILGLSLATLTFFVGLLADITLSRRLFMIKNTLSVASAPMECLITVLYWGLHTVNPSLVLPEWAPRLDLIDDLSFHAAPAISLALDLLFFSPPWTIAFLPSLGLSVAIAFGYWFWIERCYSFNEFYPYPIFEMLDTTQRIGLFGVSALLMALSTSTLIWLYSVVNRVEVRSLANGHPSNARSGNIKGE